MTNLRLPYGFFTFIQFIFPQFRLQNQPYSLNLQMPLKPCSRGRRKLHLNRPYYFSAQNMKILTSAQLHRLDAYTIEHQQITSIALMERAARTFTDRFLQQFDESRPVIVFAGPGNNGGDALAVSRMLAEAHRNVHVYLFNAQTELSADCQQNLKRLQELSLPNLDLQIIVKEFLPPRLDEETLVVDGLFGTGLNRFLTGGYAALVKYINASKSVVVSIDVPSGLMTENNATNVMAHVVRADFTYTFHCPKLAFFFPEIQPYVGEWTVLDIGLVDPLDETTASPYEQIEPSQLRSWLKPRPRFSHKGTMGHALLVAGKQNMAGCAVLAAKAALRGGVGKLTVHTQDSNRVVLQTAVPEVVLSLAPDERIKDAFSVYEPLFAPLRSEFDAVAIGPGIGTDDATMQAFSALLPAVRLPLVLDADALNIMARDPRIMMDLPREAILTPHRAELERLVGPQDTSYALLAEAVQLAMRNDVHVLIKGAHSMCVSPSGRISINTTGNPGMATAGSGDVLTGILLALLARQYTSEQALTLGVYLHGLAGDLAADSLGQESLIASDIIQFLPAAFQRLQSEN